MAAPGTAWADDTWDVDAWAANTWSDAEQSSGSPGTSAGRWVVNQYGGSYGRIGDLWKTENDRRWFVFDFGNLSEVLDGYELSAPDVTYDSGINVSFPVLDGVEAGVWVDGGTSGQRYEITIQVSLTDPETLASSIIQRTGVIRVI